MNTNNEAESFEGWAVIEIMGHNTIAGYCTQEVIGGVAMLRVDVPAVDGKPGFTKYYSGQAIYGVTPTDERTAKVAAERLRRRPVELWIVPDAPALPAPREDVDPDLEYEQHRSDYDDDYPDDYPDGARAKAFDDESEF